MKKMKEMMEMMENMKLALSQKIEDWNAELKSQIETKMTKLAQEVTELRETVNAKFGSLIVHRRKPTALNTYFAGKDLRRDIYDITVIRSGEHVHYSVQYVSPMAVSRVLTGVISSVMENNTHFKPKATDDDKNLHCSGVVNS